MANFPERFQQLKNSGGLTYEQLSAALGISQRALKYYANGEREPSLSVLIKLAEYFDVTLDYLAGRSDK